MTFKWVNVVLKVIRVGILVTLLVGGGYLIWLFGMDIGWNTVGFAFGVQWFLMLWIYLLFRLYPQLRLPKGYYEVGAEEKALFEWLGVRRMQKVLWRVPSNPKIRFKERGKDELERVTLAMIEAETAHFLLGGVVAAMMVYAGWRGWWLVMGGYLVFNLLFNVYPVLVQRYNRQRIERVMNRL
ncbi:MAG TPA: hypothetical protein VLL52_11590 [Anaerolineae bacterium]|nr:hypothetical protein [Anaerolineae bacterium]